ncbi:Tetratricopeptide repeat protein, partial [human gut metagenome]
SAKKTIMLNGNYVKTYSSLIPSIAFKQNKLLEEEPYIRIALNKEPFNFDFMITAAEYYKEVLQDSSKGMYYYTMASKINIIICSII